MAIFPSRAYRLDQGPLKLEDPKQGGTQQVRSRSGFMGAFQRKGLPRTLQVIGATLQQMDNPQGQLDQFAANEADALRRAAEEAAMSRDQKFVDQAIGSLPPEQQPWARISPEAAARGIFGPAPARYGNLERIDGRLGQRNEITGQYEWAPQIPSGMIYQPPAGYRGTAETGLEPIPGGPADVRATTEGRSRMQQMDSSIRQLDNAITVIGEALPNVDWDSTGFVGQVTRGVGGTDAYNLNQQLEPVRAILSFENLAEMRRNSATGGALGSIAVRELELLGNTVRSLDTAQGTQQTRAALNATRAQFQRTLAALRAARQEMEQGPGNAPMEPMAPEQPQERVLQWSPERGVY